MAKKLDIEHSTFYPKKPSFGGKVSSKEVVKINASEKEFCGEVKSSMQMTLEKIHPAAMKEAPTLRKYSPPASVFTISEKKHETHSGYYGVGEIRREIYSIEEKEHETDSSSESGSDNETESSTMVKKIASIKAGSASENTLRLRYSSNGDPESYSSAETLGNSSFDRTPTGVSEDFSGS